MCIRDRIKVRARVLDALAHRNITDIKEATLFCRKYITNPTKTIGELGVKI